MIASICTTAAPLAVLAVATLALQSQVPERPKVTDFPAPIRPYLEASEGLEGLEMSLAMVVGLSFGSAVERKRLGGDFEADANEARKNWNYILTEALIWSAKKPEGTLLGGGFFHDTGTRVAEDGSSYEVLRAPEFRLQAVEDVGAIVERRRLIGGMREGLSKDDAKTLRALVDPLLEEDELNPWIRHAQSHLTFMSIGAWEKYVTEREKSGTPFGTWEEFQAQVLGELAKVLIHPMRATLPAGVTKDRNFRYESEYVIQVVAAEAHEWKVPDALVAANRADKSPTLLIQVPGRKKVTHKTKYDRITVGIVAGGEHRVIHDGRWPIR